MRSIAMLFPRRMNYFHILFQSFFLLIFTDLIAKKTVDPLELFRNWDINRNGVLSRDELPNYAKKNFNKVDIDNDHLISIDEHLSYLGKDFSKNKNFKFIYDLAYADSNNPRQTLDLIIPTKVDPKNPPFLVIWVHGGGWRSGNKSNGLSTDRLPALVKTGRYAGASIGYRLSGESTWPAQIHDCKAAIRWLRGNAKTFGFNASKIAVWGASAGGHLVSMLGTTNENKKFEGTLGLYLNQSSRVNAVINFFGPSALLQMNNHPTVIDHNAPNSPESELMGFPIQKFKDKTRNASPLHHVAKDHVSFIHFHGTDDPLVPFHQSKIFHQALQKKGVKSTLITFEKGKHSMPSFTTHEFVIPFLDFTFYGLGSSLKNHKINDK